MATEAHLLRRSSPLHVPPGRRRRATRPTMRSELRALEFWRAILGECTAALLYVFLSCGAHIAWRPPHYSANALAKSLCGGLAMATASRALGPVSGAHANPALTLAMLVTGRITPLRALLYALAQCGGAIAGAALLYGLTSGADDEHGGRGMGLTLVDESRLSPVRAAGLEGALTFIVSLVAFASQSQEDNEQVPYGEEEEDIVRRRRRRTRGGGVAGDAFAIGLAYMACALVAMPATGASLNPARSLGPAFVMNIWTHHWVYWCGPAIGSVVAGLVYEYIFEPPRTSGRLVRDRVDSCKLDVATEVVTSKCASARPAHQAVTTLPHSRPGPLPCGLQRSASSRYREGPAYRTWSASGYSTTPRQQFKF